MAYLDDRGLEHLWSKFKAYVDERPGTSAASILTITLPADGWIDHQQTVEASGILADETKQVIQPMPAVANQQAYYDAGIMCTGQSVDSLTFSADTVPTDDLTVYVAVIGTNPTQSEPEPILSDWWSPEMTSSNFPSPYVVSASSYWVKGGDGTFYPWEAFNTTSKYGWLNNGSENAWLEFNFGREVLLHSFSMMPNSYTDYIKYMPQDFVVYGLQGNNWISIMNVSGIADYTAGASRVFELPVTDATKKPITAIRFNWIKVKGGTPITSSYAAVKAIKFREWLNK